MKKWIFAVLLASAPMLSIASDEPNKVETIKQMYQEAQGIKNDK